MRTITLPEKSRIVIDDRFARIGHTFRNNEGINAGNLSKPGYCFSPDDKAEYIYETMKLHPIITEFTVIENGIAIGFYTKTAFNEILGGRYGFSLFSKTSIREIMKTDFLSVDYYMPVEQVSKLAMKRPFDTLYNPIVVELEGKYCGIVTVKDLLDTCRKMAIIERDEIALMRDSLKIGLFFIDRNYIIQDQYSRYLEELFSQTDLCGKNFIDLLASSFIPNELNIIKDYLNMVFENTFDQSMLNDINPFAELEYINEYLSEKKVFQCGFATIRRDNGEVFALVSVYDITAKVDLQRKLEEEEYKRQEEMKTIYEFLQVEPQIFSDFIEDMEHQFVEINKTLKNYMLSEHEKLVSIYQSMHAIKSNAFTLEQNTFGNKVHNLECIIKNLRNKEKINFEDFINFTMEIEKLIDEKERYKAIIKKINVHKHKTNSKDMSQVQHLLLETLTKTVKNISIDMNKKVKLAVGKIEDDAIEAAPRGVIKEVLMQLIRNSVVHGIESPEERSAAGKKKTGVIRLSIKIKDNKLYVKLEDDGKGLDYHKIAKKAINLNLIKPEDRKNRKVLLDVIFSPGFSTAETEGVHAGRGIGLNLVRDRVRSNKGAIKIKSEPGKGTVFHIYFPVKKI